MSSTGIEQATNYAVTSPASRTLLANVDAPIGIALSQYKAGVPTLNKFDIKCLLVQLGELESNSNPQLVTVGVPAQGLYIGNVTAEKTQVTITNLDNSSITLGTVANLTTDSTGSFGDNTVIVAKSIGGNIIAGNFVNGCTYTVTSVGSTDFTTIGGKNEIGNVFIANSAGTGTGSASALNNQIVLASNNTVTGSVKFYVYPLKLGKYQISQTLLINSGYLNANGTWTGKDGIDSNEIFLSTNYIQDLILKNYFEEKYVELIKSEAIRVGDTKETVAGMLALTYQYQDFGNPLLGQSVFNQDGSLNIENYSVSHRANVWRNTGQTLDSQNRPGHIYFNCGKYAIGTLGVDRVGETPIDTEVTAPTPRILPALVTPSTPIQSTANLYVTGNIYQQSAYYETFSNIANTGGNLTCNFANGIIFNVPTLTANVTANLINVHTTALTTTGATIIIRQGATPYTISNVQINGFQQSLKWINQSGSASPLGFANTDTVIGFSILNLGSGNYNILAQLSTFG